MGEPIWSVDRLVAQLGRWSGRRGSLHRLLAEALRELIDSGRLPARAALPPDRVLAARLAVGRTTVVAAYDMLRAEGRLERHQGKGTWVAPARRYGSPNGWTTTANPLFLAYLSSPDQVLPLACTAPHGPPEVLADAYVKAISRLPTMAGDTGYHPLGHPELRAAIARRYDTAGTPTAADQVLVTSGGQQALALLVRLLLVPGDRAIVQVPCYPGVLELLREAGASITTVPSGSDGLDVDAWAAAVISSKPRFAYLNLTHHNPTGTTVALAARRRLAEIAAAHDVTCVDDTVLDELGFSGPEFSPSWATSSLMRVFSVGSLSKTVWGGLRIGWVRGPREDVAALAGLRAVHDLGGPVVEQLAAAELLPRLDGIALSRGAELKARHDHLCRELVAELPEWDFRPVTGGQCLWVRLPNADSTVFAQVAMRQGVVVLPGASFAPTGEYTNWLRIPFTASEADLSESVRALGKAWYSYRHPSA